MVHLQHSILFPTLTFETDAQFRGAPSEKTTPVYKLDWGNVDRIKEDRWMKQVAKTADSRFPGTLPQKYDLWVKGMSFALTEAYLTEIRRCARMAQTEWGAERRFDTAIREICLEPAISCCYVAFRMLADCLYDPKANYFYRGPDKVLATQALLYKFWAFQTGRGLVQGHARFDRIEWQINEAALKRRTLLQSLSCPKCGEKAFIESSSEGWKFNQTDVICSCGNEVQKTDGQPGSITWSPCNDDSTKHQIREFLKAVDDYEKKLEVEYRTVDAHSQGPVKETVEETELDRFFSTGSKKMSLRDFNMNSMNFTGRTAGGTAQYIGPFSFKNCNLFRRGEGFELEAEVYQGDFFSASVNGVEKLLENPKLPDFTIFKCGRSIRLCGPTVIKLSSTPPPVITIKIRAIIDKRGDGKQRFIGKGSDGPDGVVKEIDFSKTNESVITELKGKGYQVYDNNPKSILKPPQPCTYGEKVGVVDDFRVHKDSTKDEDRAFIEAYESQVDCKTEKNLPTLLDGAVQTLNRKKTGSLSELRKANEAVARALDTSYVSSGAERQADDMMFGELKDGLKDLPKGVDDIGEAGAVFCRQPKRIKVLVNGMPVVEMNTFGMSESEAVAAALKDEGIKNHTKGKRLAKVFFAPGYCLSLAFERKKPGKKRK